MSEEKKEEPKVVVPPEGDVTPPEPSKDPLDAIEDEEARTLAKRERAIAIREAKKEVKEELPKDPEPAPAANNYATKDDLKVFATRDAKKLVAPEVLDVWDELTKIPLGGFDPMDAGDMAKNMQRRYTIYQQENPEAPDPTKDLISSPNIPPSGAPKDKKPASKPLPGFKEAAQPEDWYGKPE